MAYMPQDKKKAIEVVVKAICKRHGVKATVAVRHHSTLVLNIASGSIDFFGDRNRDRWSPERLAEPPTNIDVNPYYWREDFTGAALALFAEIFPVLNDGNHDHSDLMTDYHDVGWYVDVNVGRWDKPYLLTAATVPASTPPAPASPAVVLSATEVIAASQPDPRPIVAATAEPSPAQKAAATRRANLRLVSAEPVALAVPSPFPQFRFSPDRLLN